MVFEIRFAAPSLVAHQHTRALRPCALALATRTAFGHFAAVTVAKGACTPGVTANVPSERIAQSTDESNFVLVRHRCIEARRDTYAKHERSTSCG
jgi:hypothetical protein